MINFFFFFGELMKLYTRIFLQKKGKAAPSVAASLIERLPDANDLWKTQDVVVASYVGV